MSLLDTVNKDIVQAMKSKEEATLRALRGIKSAILLAQTEKGASDDLSAEKMQLLTKLVKQRKKAWIFTLPRTGLIWPLMKLQRSL